MKESENDHEKDGGKRKPNLIMHSHGRQRRVRWSETNNWWKWKCRTKEAEAWERKRTILTRRGGGRETKKRLRKLSLTVSGSEGNKKKSQTIPMWNKSIRIRSMKIEETARWSGGVGRLIVYMGHEFLEIRYFICGSFVAFELYQIREGTRKLYNE